MIFIVLRSHRPSFKNFRYFIQDEQNSRCWISLIKTSTFPQAKSTEFSYQFLILFAIFPFPEPPCLSALPYGKSTFNILTSKMMKMTWSSEPRCIVWTCAKAGVRELQKKCNQNRLYKTLRFQWKSSYLTLRDPPYGRAGRQGRSELQIKVDQNYLKQTCMFQWKSTHLRLRDLPYGPA